MSDALSPQDRQRLDTLFERAAELPPAEHAAFVARECAANPALRAELARLLEGLAGEDLLSRIQPEKALRAGTQIGRYKLLERVGQGGMGEVYAAEQLEPVVRRVALKIIKAGMDSAQVVARFHAERQALARMSHPNIAQVFDAGTTADGRPYFVMEFVAGAPLTEYCDRRKLAMRERLELFLLVCEGVQHAHHKGIIHRDLKPSNLLVAQQDGRALPKIIDFGVARATSGQLTERTLHTMLGQIVGTLDYMSPEQADPTSVDIDARSDIYSLGVVLYQLVSGLLPFEHESRVGTPFSEIVRTIREQDPPTPSSRLRRQRGTATAIAAMHGTDERALVRQLSGDLDWICLKALEKDPSLRYPSASALAEDVRRHLAHEPVLAGRPGPLYRARKYVRRHRLGVTAGVLITAASVAGIFGLVTGRIEAIQSEALREKAKAESVLTERLTAARDLQALVAEADLLWPAHPDQVSAMEDWLARAGALTKSLPEHRTRLFDLRTRAEKWSEGDQAQDSETWNLELTKGKAELRYLQAQLDRGQKTGAPELAFPVEDLIALKQDEVALVESKKGSRRTWRFASIVDQAQYDALSELVAGLEALESGLLAADAITQAHGWSVPKRLAVARTTKERSIEGADAKQRWDSALSALRQSPKYGGLELKPQIGLLPLGEDPDSHLWEFAHLQSGEPATRGQNGKWTITEKTGLVFVLIPGGSFYMGAQSTDASRPNYEEGAIDGYEAPVRLQTVEPFFFSKFEMTQAQWLHCVGAVPSEFWWRPCDPVNMVSWNEGDTALRRLGLKFPHEREWEYAARAGTTTAWWTGADEASLEGKDNFLDLSVGPKQRRIRLLRGSGRPVDWNDGYPLACPVGTFPANPFGLHEILGNVAEGCSNHPDPYDESVTYLQPTYLSSQMARGGSHWSEPEVARSAFRIHEAQADYKHVAAGLRPARSIDD